MIQPEKITDEQFESHALEVLQRELLLDGWRGSCVSIAPALPSTPKDRAEWQKDLTVDQIMETIRRRRTPAQRG